MSSNVQPYTKEFSIAAVGGTPSVALLRYPARGTLKSIRAKVTNAEGGDGTTGTIGIYSTEAAAAAADPLYLIAGFALTGNLYSGSNLELDYANREGSCSVLVRKLYARIDLAGTGVKTVALSLTMQQPQF